MTAAVSWLPDAARETRLLLEKMTQSVEDNRACGLKHCIRMCKRIESEEIVGAKAHRWLGWAQCAVVAHGLASLDELKLINKDASALAKTKIRFQPTHRHVEGGLYRVVSRDKVLMKIGAAWMEAVLYHNEAGERFVRTKEEFQQRFTPVESA